MKISEAQRLVKEFTNKNGWDDTPNIDKFDHLHEELVEMSSHLRYKGESERKETISKEKLLFEDGVGDLIFGALRLANQLGVDAEEAFEKTSKLITDKYDGKPEKKRR